MYYHMLVSLLFSVPLSSYTTFLLTSISLKILQIYYLDHCPQLGSLLHLSNTQGSSPGSPCVFTITLLRYCLGAAFLFSHLGFLVLFFGGLPRHDVLRLVAEPLVTKIPIGMFCWSLPAFRVFFQIVCHSPNLVIKILLQLTRTFSKVLHRTLQA